MTKQDFECEGGCGTQTQKEPYHIDYDMYQLGELPFCSAECAEDKISEIAGSSVIYPDGE